MTSTLISPQWRAIVESEDLVKVYVVEQYGEKSLVFKVDVTEFEEEHLDMFREVLIKLRDNEHPNILTMVDINFDETDQGNFFLIECVYPYDKTVVQYHKENNCQEPELKSNVADIVEIYGITVAMGIEIELSVEDISLVRIKNPHLPYPQLCATPYAYIMACINKISEDPAFIHKSFVNTFDYYNKMFAKLTKEKPLESLIALLNQDTNIIEHIQQNKFIQGAQRSLEIQRFDLDTVTFEKTLGEGTFGAVMKVKDNQTGDFYALKQSNGEDIPALYREAFVISSLEYINIVQFKGYCTNDYNMATDSRDGEEHAYMLMEFCPCGDLENFINKRYGETGKIIPISELQLLIGQVMASCFFVHNKRIVHRDLKLANILVKQVEPFPWLKLCDFGFARTNDTVMMTVAGTPFTADPNILKGQGYNDQSELFSIGCILYYLIYSRYPCEDCEDFEGIIDKIESGSVEYPLPNGDENYKPYVQLTRELMTVDRKVDGADTKKKESVWKKFMRNKCVQSCLQAVAGAFEKQFGKK